jgi:hypothetical protein
MDKKLAEFRERCAESGLELTPVEAKKFLFAYSALRDEVRTSVKQNPNFYLELCNRTTEQKLSDISQLKEQGCPMSLKEYNEIQRMVKNICVIDGYAQ